MEGVRRVREIVFVDGATQDVRNEHMAPTLILARRAVQVILISIAKQLGRTEFCTCGRLV